MDNLNTRITDLTTFLVDYEELIRRRRHELLILSYNPPTPLNDGLMAELNRALEYYYSEMARYQSELNQLIMLYTQLITPRMPPTAQFGKKNKKAKSYLT